MAQGPARTAEEIANTIRTLVERIVDAEMTRQVTRRGQDVAATLAERGADVGDRANDVWRDTKPMRKQAAKRAERASRDAAKWSERTWRKTLRPTLRDLWKQRTVALGAMGSAVPVGRELVDEAAVRLGIKQREERHWGAFFLGMLIGAAAGAIAAMLLAPKTGREMRRDLSERAGEVRDEIATRAREDWVPLFQRDVNEGGNGRAAKVGDAVTDAAVEGASASGRVVDKAADEAAEAINEAYDSSVEREKPS